MLIQRRRAPALAHQEGGPDTAETTTKRTSRPSLKAKAGLAKGATGDEVTAVQEYLARFGYLAPAGAKGAVSGAADDISTGAISVTANSNGDGNGALNGSAGAIASVAPVIDTRPALDKGTFDDGTEQALRNFQTMAGLEPTGTLNEATLAKMAQPRCGNVDVKSFVATGGRWPTNDLADTAVAKVTFRTEVALDAVDDRLRGVVAYVDVPALVGNSGRSAALLHAPRAGTSAEEVGDFVRSLLAHGQLDVPTRRFGAIAEAAPAGERPTHVLVEEGDRQELRRIRFA